MVAKRRLDFSTPSRKRLKSKSTQTMVLYRGPRTEMKYVDVAITAHAASTASATPICYVGNSTGRSGRVGNYIKVHRVQGMIAIDGSSESIKVELSIPSDPTVAPGISYLGMTDLDANKLLFSQLLHTGTEPNPLGFNLNYKLPMGLICHYAGATGNTINRGNLHLCLATKTASTIVGTVRVWFTDA